MEPVIYSVVFFTILGGLSLIPAKQISYLKRKRIVFILLSLSIICFFGLRNRYVGSDTPFYVDYFLHPLFGYRGNQQDIGFRAFNAIIRFFTDNVTIYLFISALISLCGLFFLIYKNSINYFLSLSFFWIFSTSENVFLYYCSMQRQCLAMSFCFFALYCMTNYKENKRIIYSGLLFAIALSFHITSLVCLILYWAGCHIKFTKKTIKILLILIPVSYLIGTQMGSFNMILSYGLRIIGLGNSHYLSFIDGSYGEKYSGFGSLINMLSLPQAIIGEILIFFKAQEKDTKTEEPILACYIVGIIINNLFVDNLLWGRMLSYALMLSLIVIPNFITQLKSWKKIILCGGIWTIYLIKTFNMITYQKLNENFGNIINPYLFFN